ncbi:MAG: septal ring lytic transglycosylase RlpA family protein [Nitrosomonadales bacterium]|nr:septal ring lytic transglycosylase RlpA family protein [Nitrosomonadales bacterium]
MSGKIIMVVLAALLLAACGSTPQRKGAGVATAPAGGGYLAGDGPGADAPADIDAIPDAVPRSEPLHRYANRPYVALGKSYTPLTSPGNFKERGIASWYGKKFHGQRTSSGETYDMYAMSAAHPTLPLPSYARVTNLANQKSVIVRVNDRGPFLHDRVIDLSYTAAHKLGILGNGSAEVEVESLAPAATMGSLKTDVVQIRPLESAVPVAVTPQPLDVLPLESSDTRVYLQLGAFESQQNAEAFMEKMRNELGNTGKQFRLSGKDGMVRVHIGPYASVSEARSNADSLEDKLGFKPMVNLP